MNDLIWIGNTLYPRGLVFTTAAIVLVAIVAGLYALGYFVSKRC